MSSFRLNQTRINRGDVVMVDLGTRFGREQGGIRPAIVVQNNIGNYCGDTTIVAPLTASKKNNIGLPTHVVGIQLEKESIALLEQIVTIDKRRIICVLDHLDEQKLKDVDKKIKVSLGL